MVDGVRVAKAPPPLSEHTTIKSFVEPKRRTLEVKAPPPVSETIKSFAEPKPRTPELPPPVRKVPYSRTTPPLRWGRYSAPRTNSSNPP
jgi:hypothetical protein